MFNLLVVLALFNAASADELGANQLLEFLNEHQEPSGNIHTSYGYPVTYEEANLGINRDSNLLLNHYIYESLSSFSLERLPPRSVHANGSGAKGYFVVTHDVSNITNINVFNTVGKTTPIITRFSTTTGDIGSAEVRNRVKGFSIKFYTEEGNLDLTGLSTSVFLIKDPIYNVGLSHMLRMVNPRTNLLDQTMLWDFTALRPEALFATLESISAIGQPYSYRNIRGHPVHTYQVENNKGDISFIRFNWFPDAGIKNLTIAEVQTLSSSPDYYTEDLYNAISNETYPSWTFCMQVIPESEVENVPFDIFDMTLNWPEDDYPNIPVGKLVLDKHVDNHFAEVEQAAYNPGNLVPGLRGIDKIFEARIFLYRDAQIHRLGTGFNKIPVNCPINKPLTYNRDGNPPVGDNGGDQPNYYPNSFNGIVPLNKTLSPLHRPNTVSDVTNFWQLTKFYNSLSEADKTILVTLTATSLSGTPPRIHNKIIAYCSQADEALGAGIQAALNQILAASA